MRVLRDLNATGCIFWMIKKIKMALITKDFEVLYLHTYIYTVIHKYTHIIYYIIAFSTIATITCHRPFIIIIVTIIILEV